MSESRHSRRGHTRHARAVARRRERNKRLFVAVAPLFVSVAVVVAVLVLWGGKETIGQQAVPTTGVVVTTLAPPEPTADVVGVVVLQEEEAAVLVLVARHADSGGVVIGVPACTLIRTDEGFETLAESFDRDQQGALVSGLAMHLGVAIGGIAEVRWEALSDMAATVLDGGERPPTVLDEGSGASLQAAQALLAFAKMTPTTGGSLSRLGFSGDVKALEGLVAQIARDDAGSGWEASLLPGRIIEGADFCYYEPNGVVAARMLAGGAGGAPPKVAIEIQNGSGMLNVAQVAGDLLQVLGYDLAPFKNAPGFPDVVKTTIVAGSDVVSEAKRVREILMVGELREDDALAPRVVKVVLGKDFDPQPVADGTQ